MTTKSKGISSVAAKSAGKSRVEPGENIWLNVTELAHCYLDCISWIEKEPEKHIFHIPLLSKKSEKLFGDAFNAISDTMDDLMNAISNHDDIYWREELNAGRVDHMPSKSAFNPDTVFAFKREIPPTN